MILSRENTMFSLYDDFKDERMEASEMYDTLGGIVTNEVVAKDLMFGDMGYDPIVPGWDVRNADDEMYLWAEDKNIPIKNHLFSTVRFFWTLVLYVCSGFKKL
jgi:hypothetical protein